MSTLVFGAPSPALVGLIVAAVAVGVACVVAGTWLGAWAERQGIWIALDAATGEGLAVPDPRSLRAGGMAGVTRICAVRLLALLPVALAVALAWQPIYAATYRELILPQDLVTPLPIRVVGSVPWLIIGIAATWLLSDAAAAVAVRRLVLEDHPVLVAWLLGWADLARRPYRIVPTALVGVGVMALLLVPGLLAVSVGWSRVHEVALDMRDPLSVVVAVVIWVAMWLGVLVLAGAAAAFRVAAWTIELPHR